MGHLRLIKILKWLKYEKVLQFSKQTIISNKTKTTWVPDVGDHMANCLDLVLTTHPDQYQVSVSSGEICVCLLPT